MLRKYGGGRTQDRKQQKEIVSDTERKGAVQVSSFLCVLWLFAGLVVVILYLHCLYLYNTHFATKTTESPMLCVSILFSFFCVWNDLQFFFLVLQFCEQRERRRRLRLEREEHLVCCGERKKRMHSALNSDIEIWLNNKLEGAWSSEKISSLLAPATLEAAKTRFSFLDTSIKLKLLFSFVTLGKRMREDLDAHVKGILNLASQDDDEWVEVISKLFATLMTQEDLSASISDTDARMAAPLGSQSNGFRIENEHFVGLQDQLKQSREYCVRHYSRTNFFFIYSKIYLLVQEHGPPRFWPLEYPYVNTSVANYQTLQSNFNNPHFQLKHKLEEPSSLSTPKRLQQSMLTGR